MFTDIHFQYFYLVTGCRCTIYRYCPSFRQLEEIQIKGYWPSPANAAPHFLINPIVFCEKKTYVAMPLSV